ncbi:hypothetical protein DY000_02046483 [Brassica cretica]|uniref:START domain-containing protein n=1 Tax=Brassica cretica TaxID=69181 RepID=A0ABQ7END4_BRACR|nr:hypothetical protein DY000_02046483 [Brassica cretica]
MDTRQKDKEKEKEKDLPPGERTPKVSGVDCGGRPGYADDPYGLVGTLNPSLGRFRDKVLGLGRTDLWSDLISRDQTWTVVKEIYREDSGHGKMYGEWVIIDKYSSVKILRHELWWINLLIDLLSGSASPMAELGRASSLTPEEDVGFSLGRVSSGLLTQPYTCGVDAVSSPTVFFFGLLGRKLVLYSLGCCSFVFLVFGPCLLDLVLLIKYQ